MRAIVIPTGNEIYEGVVLDTSSAYIVQSLIRCFPTAYIVRQCPAKDEEDGIIEKIKLGASENMDLIIITGGSGGGHRYSDTLAKDFSHSAIDKLLPVKQAREIYGSNGHMWCKLICGYLGDSLVINLPGPYAEACSAFDAFLSVYLKERDDLEKINEQMIRAVYRQYPQGK